MWRKTAKEKAEGNGNGKSKVDVADRRKKLFSRERFMNGSTRGNERREIEDNEGSKDLLQNKLQPSAVEVEQGQIEFKETERSFDIPTSMIDICNNGRGKAHIQGTVPCLTDSKEYGKMVAEVRLTCPEQREKQRIAVSIT